MGCNIASLIKELSQYPRGRRKKVGRKGGKGRDLQDMCERHFFAPFHSSFPARTRSLLISDKGRSCVSECACEPPSTLRPTQGRAGSCTCCFVHCLAFRDKHAVSCQRTLVRLREKVRDSQERAGQDSQLGLKFKRAFIWPLKSRMLPWELGRYRRRLPGARAQSDEEWYK